ncbi:restriction system-associated AAA family ATPase [Spirosoma panaciterrae]|uniref:restriction system-associated AAA family ATPase n=1 Tax=Spirosoma panaciterrae TaxID=496058 RepID=UPI00037C7534|nr:restriction system-associated AAA family ATPase [Spirosoma panaciterrae]
MKLLRLKIENNEGFRSLQKGFEIKFHTLEDTESMKQFRPFCFAGLNGSGKSNVLEALANIFFHLELCVARYLPESIKDPGNFERAKCTPDAFTLEYLIGQQNNNAYAVHSFEKVTIIKKESEEPQLFIQPYPFDDTVEVRRVSLLPSINKQEAAEGKQYLPQHIVGYSSGENEILSLPFIKSRLIHLDEYRQATRDNYERYDEPENSLIYIDSNMSQAVLLSCLLFEKEDTLAPFRDVDNTGILGLRSFRMNIRLHDFVFKDDKGKERNISILKLIEKHQLDSLKKCATALFYDEKEKTLWLDFFVNDATKQAFQKHFKTSFECFQCFRLLYELNSHFVNEKAKEEVYRSKGVYTDGKLPVGSAQQDVFHFLDFYITKELKKTGEKKDLLLRSFSDGEHQFIHTMGICLLLKNKRSILLLDEPETHFNPSWRAKFVKVLNDSISAGSPEASVLVNFNVHLLKDILLTSHSPFIISDCLPDNVILFEKDGMGKTTAMKVSELENTFNTYGTSVELILDRLFGYTQSIGDLSFSQIEALDIDSIQGVAQIEKAKAELRKLGESIEKDLVLSRLNKKLKSEPDVKNL